MRKNPDDLYLHEQILLLSLRDAEGTLESKAGMYRMALGGAVPGSVAASLSATSSSVADVLGERPCLRRRSIAR